MMLKIFFFDIYVKMKAILICLQTYTIVQISCLFFSNCFMLNLNIYIAMKKFRGKKNTTNTIHDFTLKHLRQQSAITRTKIFWLTNLFLYALCLGQKVSKLYTSNVNYVFVFMKTKTNRFDGFNIQNFS